MTTGRNGWPLTLDFDATFLRVFQCAIDSGYSGLAHDDPPFYLEGWDEGGKDESKNELARAIGEVQSILGLDDPHDEHIEHLRNLAYTLLPDLCRWHAMEGDGEWVLPD